MENNTVKKADPSVADETVKFYELVVISSLAITTTSDIPEINHFEIRFDSITDANKTVHIPTTTANTMLVVNYAKIREKLIKNFHKSCMRYPNRVKKNKTTPRKKKPHRCFNIQYQPT